MATKRRRRGPVCPDTPDATDGEVERWRVGAPNGGVPRYRHTFEQPQCIEAGFFAGARRLGPSGPSSPLWSWCENNGRRFRRKGRGRLGDWPKGKQSPLFEGRVMRCEVASIEAFVQQVAVSYLTHGYFFYVAGVIPEGKDVRRVDAKLVERYGLDISKWTRARRKRQGLANVAYLRCGRFFVLLATHGEHRFFEDEGQGVRDFRRVPLKFASYAISHRGGHPHVRIAEPTIQDLKEQLRSLALRRTAVDLGQTLHRLPFEPYAPVRSQFCELLRMVNRIRAVAGLEPVPRSVLRLRRRVLLVFEDDGRPTLRAA